jgi:RecA-family ATPase
VPDPIWDDEPDLHAEAEAERKRYRLANGGAEDWRELPAINEADVARWKDRQPPEIIFTIADLVPQGMVTLLTSIGGAGKTLLMQLACTVIAAGRLTFLGKSTTVGKAAGVFAEDPDGVLHLRQARINEVLGISYDDIAERLFLQSYFGLSAQLWREGQATRFMRELEDQLVQIDRVRLVTLDNQAFLFSGDENSRSEVTEFLAALNGLADRLSIGIVLSAHASKSSDGTPLRVSSGSTAWVNACRSVLELKAGEKDPGPSLTVVKANHAASGTTIQLAWADGLLVPRAPPGGILSSIHQRTCERVFLELLDKTTAEGQTVSSNPKAGNYAPRLFGTRPERERYAKTHFEQAMQALFASDEIANENYGRKSDMRSRLIHRPREKAAE